MVAQRTLTPYVRVRILLPLPKKKTGNVEFPVFFHFGAAGCFWPAFQRQSRSDGAGGKRLARGAAGDRSAAWLFRRKENRQILRIW